MPSPFTDQFWRALADYGVVMPALGSGDPPATWLAEYTRVRKTAFASVLITASATEGANASGARNFPQDILTDALHCRRYELDSLYVLPPHLVNFPTAKIQRATAGTRRGVTMRFGA